MPRPWHGSLPFSRDDTVATFHPDLFACGATDMRKGFDGLAVLTQQVLEQSPHSGALFAFRGKRGDLVKLLWYDGQGLCLFSKRMDRGRCPPSAPMAQI